MSTHPDAARVLSMCREYVHHAQYAAWKAEEGR